METQLVCGACGNRCLAPPSPSRDYDCPRCGHRLPRRRGAVSPAVRARLSLSAQYALMLVLLVGAGVVAVRAGLLGRREPASLVEAATRPSAQIYLTAMEKRNYEFRLHQLEQDLKRDDTDFEVLRRLGQLHLRLAVGQAAQRASHLRKARFYLRRAGDMALTSREAERVRALLDAANSPNPSTELVILPGDLGAPPRAEEEVVRMRLGWLEEQAGLHPRSSRLLCRVADNYVALYSVMVPGEEGRFTGWPGASSLSDRGEARHLAEQYYRRAMECATTQEARCRALYGEAQLYRMVNEPGRAAAALQRLLELQPNNWFAALEMAGLSRQLHRRVAADRYQALSVRWRTRDWL